MSIRYLMEDAQESIQNVIGKLEEKPLNIPVVLAILRSSNSDC